MKFKYCLLSLFILFFFKSSHAQVADTDSAYLEYVKNINATTTSFDKLLPVITKPGNTIEQKLKLVYYWVFEHIDFDTQRFLVAGPLQPLSTEETLKSGKGLCYEYNGLVDIACNYLKVTGFDIEGYVKYYGFKTGESFTQNNHIWHAVLLDGKWKMIDLLWASGTLSIKGGNYKFNKALQKSYFLAMPDEFIKTHLPADPVLQFEEKPLTMDGFTAREYGIDDDKRGAYLNYADSIKANIKLTATDREVRSGLRAYQFNPNNPDQLIIIYYNSAVALIDRANATRSELVKSRRYFSQCIPLIEKTSTKELKALLPVCGRGIASVNTRLKNAKS